MLCQDPIDGIFRLHKQQTQKHNQLQAPHLQAITRGTEPNRSPVYSSHAPRASHSTSPHHGKQPCPHCAPPPHLTRPGLISQLPLGLLNAAQGRPMLVELKSGENLNGHLVNCDTWMNLTLKSVVQTSPEGDKFHSIPEVYVKGNNVCC